MNSELNSSEQPIYNANTNNTPLIGIRKRQQPLLTSTAHVFQIDPITKKSWIPSSTTALPVSFFYDSSRGLYRIICTDGSKTLVNSTLLPGMNFTKTSQKFGQWSDKQTSIVYGLGFSSENELEKFDEQFHEVLKESFRSTPVSSGVCVGSPARHIYSNGTSSAMNESTGNMDNYATIGSSSGGGVMDMNANAVSYQINTLNNGGMNGNKNSNMGSNLNNVGSKCQQFNTIGHLNSPAKVLRFQQQQMLNGNSVNNNNGSTTLQNIYNSPKHTAYNAPLNKLINESIQVDSAIISNGKMTPEGMQLKYENEKLRQALQQSSANAKIWEYELATLKQNNAKLTTALQECNINVEDWKHQLQRYKEENQSLRIKILDIEADVGGSAPGYAQQHSVTTAGGESELGKQLDELRNKVNYYGKLLDDKDEQINCLRIRTGCMEQGIGLKQMNICANGNDKDFQVCEYRSNTTEMCPHEYCMFSPSCSHNGDSDILWTSIQTVHSQLQTTVETQDFQKKVLEALSVQLSTKLGDLTLIQDRMKEALGASLR